MYTHIHTCTHMYTHVHTCTHVSTISLLLGACMSPDLIPAFSHPLNSLPHITFNILFNILSPAACISHPPTCTYRGTRMETSVSASTEEPPSPTGCQHCHSEGSPPQGPEAQSSLWGYGPPLGRPAPPLLHTHTHTHTHIALSRSHGEKSGEGLGSKLCHGTEMVDLVSTNWVHITY